MASGLHLLKGNISRHLSRCRKHSISSINPYWEKWRSITSISFYPGFLDDTYTEIKKQDNADKALDLFTLKQKEKGDWRKLTLQEKRALYHVSFKQPLCDIEQQEDEWKLILAGTFTAMGLMTLGLFMWISHFERSESVRPLQIDSKVKEETEMSFNKTFSDASSRL